MNRYRAISLAAVLALTVSVAAQAQDVFNFSGQAGNNVDGATITSDNNPARTVTFSTTGAAGNFQFASNAATTPSTSNPANFGNNLPADPFAVIYHTAASGSPAADVVTFTFNQAITHFTADFAITDYITNTVPANQHTNVTSLTLNAKNGGSQVGTTSASGTSTAQNAPPSDPDAYYAYQGVLDFISATAFTSVDIYAPISGSPEFAQYALGNIRVSPQAVAPAAVPEWNASVSLLLGLGMGVGVLAWKRRRARQLAA